MAIDTAEKRRSAAGIAFHPLGPGVTPNSDKDAEWRQQVGWGYSGIEVGAVVAATRYLAKSMTWRRRWRTNNGLQWIERDEWKPKSSPSPAGGGGATTRRYSLTLTGVGCRTPTELA